MDDNIKNNIEFEEYKNQIYNLLVEMNWKPSEAKSLMRLLEGEILSGWNHNLSCEVMVALLTA